jgi:hypothetical protein
MKKIFIGIIVLCFSANGIAGELEGVSEQYLSAYKEKDLRSATSKLHCPENYSKQEAQKDHESISKALSVFIDEFGALETYKTSQDNLYVAAMVACGTLEYWENNKPVKTLVYETKNINGKNGYIIFSYSIINKEYVLAFVHHGIPMKGNESVNKIKQVYKNLASIGT